MVKFIEDYFHQCCPNCDSQNFKAQGQTAYCNDCRCTCNYYDLLPVDKDHGPIKEGHVCKHNIRWPHACDICDDEIYSIIKGKLPI